MRYVKGTVIFFIALFVLMVLEYGRITTEASEIILPLIFALVVGMIYLKVKRLPILILSSMLLFFMVILYLFDLLSFADWIGSLGFGMLFVVVSSYLSELIKHGFIEKF